MALAMLDVYSISLERYMPGFLLAGSRKGLLGSFLVGVSSGFVLGPCTAPVLAVILGAVAARQNLLYGGTLLFVFSLGMGTLLIIVGTSTAALAKLPKSGAWMIAVKKISGIVMLAAGAYFLYSAIIP
jgi:thiol:disulfide interchange protein DsbD